MAFSNSATLLKVPRRMRFRVTSEEAFDHVEPGRRGGCEVQMESWMRPEPAFDGGRLMRGIVVDDEMQSETGRGLLIDQLEKAQKLTMPVAWHAGSDDAAVQHVERGSVVVPLRL